ncbi:hypothetical protein EPUL_003400, partial [Erysiphe pulchra]
MALKVRLLNTAPLDYATPPWPSLYWPLTEKIGIPKYLYFTHDIWFYTLLWTLIMFAFTHGVVAVIAVVMQIGKGHRSWQYVWAIPLANIVIAGIEAVLAGSVVGVLMISKPGSRIRIWILQDVNLDTIFMGTDQCTILDRFFLLVRWRLITTTIVKAKMN